jgi:hypothetical protein
MQKKYASPHRGIRLVAEEAKRNSSGSHSAARLLPHLLRHLSESEFSEL